MKLVVKLDTVHWTTTTQSIRVVQTCRRVASWLVAEGY